MNADEISNLEKRVNDLTADVKRLETVIAVILHTCPECTDPAPPTPPTPPTPEG